MEIKVNIPQNDYVQPTQVRPEIVQGICDAFLAQNCWNIFHPKNDSCYRRATLQILRYKGKKFSSFHDKPFHDDEEAFRFYGAEMSAAFSALRKAGYHMFRVYQYGSWMGYVCRKKPYYDGGTEVFSFDDFID